MIQPQQAWCIQICTTSVCWPSVPHEGKQVLSACSDCTRLLAHEKKRYVMTPEQFEQCVQSVKNFPKESMPCPQGRRKVVGIFGGEPLLTPYFPDYVDILCKAIPDARNRGLWTSLDWRIFESKKWGAAKPWVIKLLGGEPGVKHLGYINWNMHEEAQQCGHQPSLVAINDVIKDEKHRWELINDCWVQREWSPAYALNAHNQPKFYFCELASSFDRVYDLGTGLDLTPDVWKHTLTMAPDAAGVLRPSGVYAKQILSTCGKHCGAPLPLPKRRDREWKDDISRSNLIPLQMVGSPMVARGDYVEFTDEHIASYNEAENKKDWRPEKYITKRVPR